MRNLHIFAATVVLVLLGRLDKVSAVSLTTLYGFTGGTDGAQPLAGLVEGSDSNLYGTSFAGGTFSEGTVFMVTTSGTLTTLYSFAGGTDGANPKAALVEGLDGNFYGTTSAGGGSSGAGTVFKISPAGVLTVLFGFTGGVDGGQPSAGLIQATDSNFYGTSFSGGIYGSGTVFRISSAGTLTTLWSFTGGVDGGQPSAGLVEGSNGRFYGTTSAGGSSGLGAVYKISSAGAFTALWNFTGGTDGANPLAGLIVGGDGDFYGTTSAGGSGGAGTVFKITPGGNLIPLYDFAGGLDGASPQAGLIQGSAVDFYGTTSSGGSSDAGTIFTLVQPCSYSLSPTRATVPATAFNGTFALTTSETNCPWTAASSVDWITITSDTNGLGDATIAYSVAANPGATVRSRVGTITVAGKKFTITQQSLVFGQYLQGTYAGLILQTNAPSAGNSGSITMVLDKTGSFAAKLTVGGVRSSFKGQFDTSGNATSTVARSKLTSLQVTLHLLAVSNGTDQVIGTVSDGVFTSGFLGNLAVFSSVNPSPFAGRYTFFLAPADSSDPTVPQGYGYGTLTVTTSGSGLMKGVLGDGTKIKGTAPLSEDGMWPLYNALYQKQGACIGWVTIDTNDMLGATVNWFKPATSKGPFYPAEFTTTNTLIGATYVSPTAGGPSIAGSGTLTLGGGNLTSNLVKTVVIDANGNATISPAGADHLKLKVKPATGQLSGSFQNPVLGKKTIKLNGTLVQTNNAGAGFFLGTDQSGFVTIEPAP